jgi:hypothetical protein
LEVPIELLFHWTLEPLNLEPPQDFERSIAIELLERLELAKRILKRFAIASMIESMVGIK